MVKANYFMRGYGFFFCFLFIFIANFKGFGQGSQIAIDTWLVGQYDFRSSFKDNTQYHNDLMGTNFSTLTLPFGPDRFCNVYSSLYLNGSQYLSNTHTKFFSNKTYTITVWLKTDKFTSPATLVDIGSDPGLNNGQRIICPTNGSLEAQSGTNGTQANALVSSIIGIPIGSWVFVAVVRDYNSFSVYIDGALSYQKNVSGYPPTYYNQQEPSIYVGSDPDQSHFLSGNISDLHIYNEPLSPENIKAIYGFNEFEQIQTYPNKLCVNNPITFHLDSANANSISWDFGDSGPVTTNTFSTSFTIQHSYAKPGTYFVTALLNTICSVHAPVSYQINVGICPPPCVFPVAIYVLDSCLEHSLTFDVRPDSSVTGIIWDFGDKTGMNSTVFPFQGKHQYSQPGIYRVTATVTDSCHTSIEIYRPPLTVLSCLSQPPPVIPNVFTPNGDGHNDYWDIPALIYYPDCQMNIYDRWGSLVYTSAKGYENPFNGYFKGNRLPVGAYYYVLVLKAGEKPLVGSVSIVY